MCCSCGPHGALIQARRRQVEMLRGLAIADAGLAETIARDTSELPFQQDERIAEFVKNTAGRLHRISEHVELFATPSLSSLTAFIPKPTPPGI